MIKTKDSLRLKIGNLILAIWLSTIPTTITYATFGLHGLNVCKELERELQAKNVIEVKNLCDKAAWDTPRNYIFLIGFFITLPTWFWFYLSMKRKKD